MHVRGTASAGEAVAVTFHGDTQRTVEDELGRWSLYLKAGAARGPFQLEVQGTNRIIPDRTTKGRTCADSLGEARFLCCLNTDRSFSLRSRRALFRGVSIL